MKKPFVISFIGRPNVGKSTLFNRLLQKQHKALTHDTPGVTRDRHYGMVAWDEHGGEYPLVLVDTGGFYPEKIEENETNFNKFFNLMGSHAKLAIEESDLVLFVVDVREGLNEMDKGILQVIRASKKPFYVLANKWDSSKQSGDEFEFYGLGIEEDQLLTISGSHGLGLSDLKEKVIERAKQHESELTEQLAQRGLLPDKEPLAKVALLGAPNVGKSTLLNAMLGHDRALVSDIAGTTVDPIEGYFNLHMDIGDGEPWHSVQMVDTAGIRKQKKVKGPIETHSVYRSIKSISEADIIFYMVDARVGVNHQDRRLIDIAVEQGKSVLILLNKYDLVDKDLTTGNKRMEWLESLKYEVPWLDYCDFIPLSAINSSGLKSVKTALKQTILVRKEKVPTSKLNQALFELMERHTVIPKRSRGGARLKLKYASQVKSGPPTFVLYVNRQDGIPVAYKRYLRNGLRSAFSFKNTPIHLIFRRESTKKNTSADINVDESVDYQFTT